MSRYRKTEEKDSITSRRRSFSLSFRDCIHRVKRLYQGEDHPSRFCHRLHNRKSASHTSMPLDSTRTGTNEVIITADQKEEKHKEYQNDLQRMEALRKVQYTDPEQYQMGCMLLKWYFENKARHPGPLPQATPPLKLATGDVGANRNYSLPNNRHYCQGPRALKSAPKQQSPFNLSYHHSSNRRGREIFEQFCPSGEIGDETSRAARDNNSSNDEILGDFMNMIDDYIEDTVSTIPGRA
ncbi:(ZYRO0E04136g) [Zygosaccharomyces parabailii]|uniref:ZYBA0S06-01904g1_1 n=1 Tax=Zygosaccharomyces bailii (strain CLIB 213 / ATCC 58445 / CBS 680 / BCRC 21525 / NBRC 1098 / NCYC 1416 / NRRL Y-2227) TaxID=1333698 RepID=A0A8J2T881_ZYGB2|nr:(ZYRO0E04136g) [Zygosaccharomyces parabailii]CDF90154.1 ZYBA0S06-01904g1_1 [Zygosaccharomyces bailii CLIB 213]